MGGQIERETYQWLLLIQKQEQLGIHISNDMVAQAAKGMLSHAPAGQDYSFARVFFWDSSSRGTASSWMIWSGLCAITWAFRN